MSHDEQKQPAPLGSRTRDTNSSTGREKPLQHLSAARRRQGLSLRCVAKRLNTTIADVRDQEDENRDLLLSELYAWQQVLEVPISELLAEPDDSLSPQVLDRARMLRVMKTARAVRSHAKTAEQQHLAETLLDQLTDVMPELKSVSAWPSVGQRRTSDEMGKIVENPIPENWLYEAI